MKYEFLGDKIVFKVYSKEFVYPQDVRACNSLNKLLGTNFKKVFRKQRKQWKWSSIPLDYNNPIIIMTQSGRLVEIFTSEWGGLYDLGIVE